MITDTLLPSSIPFSFVDSIAPSPSRLGRMYDTQLMEDNAISNGDMCYIHNKMVYMTIDWKPGYKEDAYTSCIIKALQTYGGNVL